VCDVNDIFFKVMCDVLVRGAESGAHCFSSVWQEVCLHGAVQAVQPHGVRACAQLVERV
jgi:hypothetical protein